jgi:outer membrane protein OmpA-like peptidoglycan-associated protein
MKMRFVMPLILIVSLNACASNRYQSRIEREEHRREKLATQNIRQMLNTGQIAPIEFDFDSAVIKEEFYPILDKVAAILLRYPKVKLAIEGHCDDIASHAYNDELAMLRAEAVKNYLVGKGIYPDSIRTFGYGKRYKMFEDASKRARALKRRAELIFKYGTWESVF